MMNHWQPDRPRQGRRLLIASGLSIALASTGAVAQYANDASNQIGAGGFNTAVQPTVFNTANLFVTGNVTGGRSFQGFSPISDPSAFRGELGSTVLSRFRRDSFNLPQMYSSPSPAAVNPFFAPSRTIGSVSAIERGLTRPGSSEPMYSFSMPNTQPGMGGPIGNALDRNGQFGGRPPLAPNLSPYTRPVEELPGAQQTPFNTTGQFRQRDRSQLDGLRLTDQQEMLRRSSVFGTDSPVGVRAAPPLSETYRVDSDLRSVNPINRESRVLNNPNRRPSAEEMLARSNELISPSAFAPRVFDAGLQDRLRDALTGRPLVTERRYAATIYDPLADSGLTGPAATAVGNALNRAPGGLPATELAPMQVYYGSEFEAGDESLLAMIDAANFLTSVDADPDRLAEIEVVPSLQEQYDDAVSLVDQFSDRPINSLAVGASERVTVLLAEAEEHVQAGKFFEAASAYGVAAAIDPDNPLVHLGYAHTLAAAGEYRTAVLELEKAIDRFSGFSYLRLNLNDLLDDPRTLDIRRADLERRLDERDDYTLRFLLGYLEYYSGLEKFGLPNLRKAADQAPPDSPIARFPALITPRPRQRAEPIDPPIIPIPE